jgi:hypothetical protein
MPAGVSAWTPLANLTLTSSQAQVNFTSISQSYRDLVLVMNPLTAATEELYLRLNADTGTTYNYVTMRGSSGGKGSSVVTSTNQISLGATTYSYTTSQAAFVVNVMDYSQTDKQKALLIRSNEPSSVEANAARWANTAAVTQIRIYGRFGQNFTTGASFALYGVSA